jgi:hypothetical protein
MLFKQLSRQVSNINAKLTSTVAADRLQHLQADTCDVDLGCRNAKVEALWEIWWVGTFDSGRAFHFDRAIVLVERHADVGVAAFLAKLSGKYLILFDAY